MTKRVLHIGAGGFGEVWCREFLPPNVKDGTIEVAGLLDLDSGALRRGQKLLGLEDAACFSDAEEAFSKTQADFCTIVVPPAFHEEYVDRAIARGMDILSEKPIADTLETSFRIADKVQRAGIKMAVTMSHRFDQDKATLHNVVRHGGVGRINTISARLQSDFRRRDSWRPFRHRMMHPLLIEGAVHHLDIIADLADAECSSIFARTWRPAWAEYQGDTDGIVVLSFANGVQAVYEGSASHATGLNDWQQEYFRVDGEWGTAVLSHREVEVFRRLDGLTVRQSNREGRGQPVPPTPGEKWANTLLIERFVRWLDGGEPLETEVTSNLRSVLLVFAAVASAETGAPVSLPEFTRQYRTSS
jgi:predicted dehydrogenase